MNFEVCHTPFFHLIIRDFFTPIENRGILKEAIKLKNTFAPSVVGGQVIRSKFRDNTVCYYDQVFGQDRKKSKLLSCLDERFQANREFREILASSPWPVSEFMMTTTHETQVSRYGDRNQKYDWHIDRFANNQRLVSLVYWFFKEPKKFTGGDMEITDSPIWDGKTVDKNAEVKRITPENNMALVFGGSNCHRVRPTKSPIKFAHGRFSVNCWVGFK